MDLPREVRNQISGYALPNNETIELWPRSASPSDAQTVKRQSADFYKRKISPRLKLLRVCKQLNAECAPLFYGRNEFRFTNLNAWIVLCAFMHTIGPANRAELRRLTVHIPFGGYCHEMGSTDKLAETKSSLEKLYSELSVMHLSVPVRKRGGFDNTTAFKDACLILAKADRLQSLQLVLQPNFRVLDEQTWTSWDSWSDYYGRLEVEGIARRYDWFWEQLVHLQRTTDKARVGERKWLKMSLVRLVRQYADDPWPWNEEPKSEDEMNHVSVVVRAVDNGLGITEASYDYTGRYVVGVVHEETQRSQNACSLW